MPYQNILVPLDGSLLAEYIFPHVEEIAKAHGSVVTLVHVVPSQEPAGVELTPSQKQSQSDLYRYLTNAAQLFSDKGITIRWELLVGDPVQELMRYVDSHDIDLVIMSTHGQGESLRRKVGSVATALLENVPVPLLLVRVPQSIARL